MKYQEGLFILKYVSKKCPIVEAIVPAPSHVNICPIIAGKVTKDTANIIGIIQA